VVAETQAATDNVTVDVLGSGIAAASVTLYPAVAEEVERVLFRAGQQVKKDQLLIQLDDRDEQLAVKLAKARMDGTRQLLNRYKRAQGPGAVAANALDEAQVAHRQAEIELEMAQEQLRQRSIRAPFAGVVGIAQVDPGDRVRPDTALTTLDDRTSLSVAFQVPEPFLARLEQGQTLNLNTVAFPDRHFEGKITHIDSRIADASLEQVRTLYTEGLTGFLNVLEVQRTWLENQRELVRTQADRVRAQIALFEAMGVIDQEKPSQS
jgi:membrane fusion protein (multidrug efflux system)